MMKTNNLVVVFDLDDTLYYEIDYLKSAYKEIANVIVEKNAVDDLYQQMLYQYHSGNDVFDFVLSNFSSSYSKSDLLKMYRNHRPDIVLTQCRIDLLQFLITNNIPIGLITDGRSIGQRSKIDALGLNHYIFPKDIVISEEFGSTKPCPDNFRYFHSQYSDKGFVYVGDNISKDFIAPNQLGWKTICLKDRGVNIHKQSFGVNKEYLPTFICDNFKEIQRVLETL
ncbi:MAG: HAD family hydrolase [Tannerellaceae bacterium]